MRSTIGEHPLSFFALGFVFGLGMGFWLSSFVVHAQSQPGNPYAPGSFQSDTLIYQGMVSQDTDNYLNSRPAYSGGFRFPSLENPCPR